MKVRCCPQVKEGLGKGPEKNRKKMRMIFGSHKVRLLLPDLFTIRVCFISEYSNLLGSVKLIKGSIASSQREKRNAKKRSFEHSLSATAAKILKMEQKRETVEKEKVHLQCTFNLNVNTCTSI